MERALATGEGEGSGRPFIVGMPTEVFGPWSEPWPQVRGRGRGVGQARRGQPDRTSDNHPLGGGEEGGVRG